MRIADALITRTSSQNLAEVTTRLEKLQAQASSGVRIQRPSDDPSGTIRAAQLRSGLTAVETYVSGVNTATSWLKAEDSALGRITDVLRQGNTLGLQGVNPLSDEVRDTVAKQIDALRASLLQVANDTHGNQALFAGTKTGSAPFADTSGTINYAGNSGTILITIGDGIQVPVNHTGAEVFNLGGVADSTVPDLFATLQTLADAVRTGDTAGTEGALTTLSQQMQRVSSLRGETGTRLQQTSMATDQLAQSKLVLTDLLGDTESADLAGTLVDLKSQELLYQAASYVSSSIKSGGLLNWLR